MPEAHGGAQSNLFCTRRDIFDTEADLDIVRSSKNLSAYVLKLVTLALSRNENHRESKHLRRKNDAYSLLGLLLIQLFSFRSTAGAIGVALTVRGCSALLISPLILLDIWRWREFGFRSDVLSVAIEIEWHRDEQSSYATE